MKTKLTNWALHTISANNLQFMSPLDIRECIYAIKALPPLPGTLSKAINLLADPDVDARAGPHIDGANYQKCQVVSVWISWGDSQCS
jgi:hypothetical protein